MITKNKTIENKVTFIAIGLFSILMIMSIFIRYIFDRNKALQGYIYPNIYIDKQLVGNKTKKDVLQIFSKMNSLLKKNNVYILYENQIIATFSASQLKISTDIESLADHAMLIGRSSHTLTRILTQINTLFLLKKYTFTTTVTYDKSVLKDYISTIEEQYSYPAKNALFSFENGKVISFRQEKNGLQIQTADFLKNADAKLLHLKIKSENITLPINSKIIKPKISLAQANSFGIEELIGTGKSDYTHSIPERIHNLTLAASKFNGVLIPKGKVFSFNKAIGDISSITGYKPAYIIKDGKTILGDGGGVCQVSTTLFRTALHTGLPIIERHPHAYRVQYYENDEKPGFDATVYSPSTDLKILNDTQTDILIQVENNPDTKILIFRFYGKNDKRKVEISPVTVYDIQSPPPPIYQDDPTLKKGIQKQIDFAAWGAKSMYSYKVTYSDKIVKENKIYSTYTPWHAVYLNGTGD